MLRGKSAFVPETTVTSTQSSVPLLKVVNLEVTFPSVGGTTATALSDFSFEMHPGEILGLVGESGSGKTVLARTLLGLPPSPGRVANGTVEFNGRNILEMSERDQRSLRGSKMSMIVSNPRAELNPLIPVGKQIATMLVVHQNMSNRAAQRAALDMLIAVQIPDPAARMNAYPHELSGGMAQRIVIAIALICSPQFIVSDDATSGLDVTVQAQILELLRKLTQDAGSAMLFITRDMAIAAHHCDRVAVMFGGQIMEIAPRHQLFESPRHPMTIMLMTAFSHNEKLRQMWTKNPVPDEKTKGCVFANRCPRVKAECRTSVPPLANIETNHAVRCFYPVVR